MFGEVKRIEEKLTRDIRRIEEKLEPKIDGISKRLENQEFVSRSIVFALIVAILGGFAKLFGLIGNP
ncbi:hypothetical protein NIES593_22255 [Hydrococcus rivularis NIES-593]|uniref:DUF4164 domain-containing protein n=1 Tax=Hydrococcus rivularis NIES-593 TaxID=1921803 RepID=A0A1U7H7P5_9CYAN|nr:hypothetical protein NIES593_22255 [Hydrococcus rivularis NIES-593]